ncbi:MAG: FdhF/YdeP family oxidoreductase [Bdellovibrionota bacterium]
MKSPELNPLEKNRPQIKDAKRIAGGLPAITQSMRHVAADSGLLRGTNELLRINQMNGYDCPGCAWPDPDDRRTPTEFCENGAKAIAEEATTRIVDPEFFRKNSVLALSELSDYEIGKSGRIAHPMYLKEGGTHYEAIEWDQAFSLIAQELNALESPDEAVFYTSGRTSNEAAFLYQLFVRMFGTNNLPDCSNMCHESSGVALSEAIGVGKGSVTLKDFDKADCILVIGQNPGTNHPRMLTTLEEASNRGAKIISINPLFETGMNRFIHPQHFWRWFGRGTKISCLHIPVQVNGDIALFKGIMKELLAKEEILPGSIFDRTFIEDFTSGYDEFLTELKSTSWEDILTQSGVGREHIQAAAEIISHSKSIIACYAMGITQQKNGVEAIQEILNMLLLGGNLGREGAGICPVRGHSNVQGDRTMGIYEKPAAPFLDALDKEFQIQSPREHGLDTVESIEAMMHGRAKVFFAMGGNFLSATPDTHYVAKAMQKLRLTVQVSTKLNRSHLIHGRRALILPALARTDIDQQASGKQFVSVEDSMGVVHKSEGNLKPLSSMQKSEVAIVAGLARATFKDQKDKSEKVDWQSLEENYDRIRDHIEKVIPGFQQFNDRVRQMGGFYLPHNVRDNRQFATKSKKAQFSTFALPILTIPDGHLRLMTLRSHDQFNTTIYGLHDRYRGVHNGRRVIFMNIEDIRSQGFAPGQWVDITSHFKSQTRSAERWMIVAYDIPRKNAAAYFPEANVLVPIDSTVDKSNTPTYKCIDITLKASAIDLEG